MLYADQPHDWGSACPCLGAPIHQQLAQVVETASQQLAIERVMHQLALLSGPEGGPAQSEHHMAAAFLAGNGVQPASREVFNHLSKEQTAEFWGRCKGMGISQQLEEVMSELNDLHQESRPKLWECYDVSEKVLC